MSWINIDIFVHIPNSQKFRSSEELVQFLKDGQAIQEIVSKDGDHESNDEQITFE